MRLRLFRAPAMAAAMTQVRRELGAEAIILSSRRVDGGIEVTAGLDDDQDLPPPLPPPPIAVPDQRAGPAAEAPASDTPASDTMAMGSLAWHGVPRPLAHRLQAGPLAFALSAVLRFVPLRLAADDPPLLLVGPPGAGKTLTTARLATRLVLAGQTPVVVTADARRAGAAEQLAAFTRILNLDLLAASHPTALARALDQARGKPGGGQSPVLIDAPGTDPFDAGDLAAMQALAASAGARTVAVLPAGMDAAESAEMAAAYAAAGATALIATRLDLARRLGGVIAAAASGLPLAELGIGPGAADGLIPATPGWLAKRLAIAGMPKEQCP